jgi:hypothetical protein
LEWLVKSYQEEKKIRMPTFVEDIIDDINAVAVEVDDVGATNSDEEELDSDNESLLSEDDSSSSEVDCMESDDEDTRAPKQQKIKWKDAVDPYRGDCS